MQPTSCQDTRTYRHIELQKELFPRETECMDDQPKDTPADDIYKSPVLSLHDLTVISPQQQGPSNLSSNFFNPLEFSPLRTHAPHLSLQTIHGIYQFVQLYNMIYSDEVAKLGSNLLVRRTNSLERSLVFTKDRHVIVLLNRTNNPNEQERDKLLGKGSYKIVTLAVDLAGTPYASASFKESATEDELDNYTRFSHIQGFIQCNYVVTYSRSEKELKKFRHPEFNEIKTRVFLEYCDAGNLSTAIRERSLSLKDKKNIFTQVLITLSELHENECCVHRDVKPGNILLKKSPTGEIIPKIADLDTICDEDDEMELVRPCSTITYSSPEFAKAYLADDFTLQDKVKQNNDVWGFGCTMFKLLEMGTLPWGKHDSKTKILDRLSTAQKRWFGEPNPNTPEHLVWQALTINEYKRPSLAKLAAQLPQVTWPT
ncbi:MAG: protein kinase [Chlamydiae bacterium]|nr:protein kinase [Chlamydiota bacterium]